MARQVQEQQGLVCWSWALLEALVREEQEVTPDAEQLRKPLKLNHGPSWFSGPPQ